jgi:CDK-activating kinase assembly factor MAT1
LRRRELLPHLIHHIENTNIRTHISRSMNKLESDFERLLDYNNYLETVEEITWNLILNTDAEATERKLRLWEAAQKAELNPNASFHPQIDDNTSTLSGASHVVLKKGATQRKALATNTPDPAGAGDETAGRDTGFVFQGLKKREIPKPEAPFDAFDGWTIEPQYYILQDEHQESKWVSPFKNDPAYYAGGWDTREYYSRMMVDALGGLGVFIEDELTARGNAELVSGDADIGTENAASAALGMKDVMMQDAF